MRSQPYEYTVTLFWSQPTRLSLLPRGLLCTRILCYLRFGWNFDPTVARRPRRFFRTFPKTRLAADTSTGGSRVCGQSFVRSVPRQGGRRLSLHTDGTCPGTGL